MLPLFSMCRRAIWDGIDGITGKRILHSVFPEEIVEARNEHEMQIELTNGSTISLVGSDNPDRLVGAPPIWITFSEAALSQPAAWSFLRPILAQNKGTAVFISTPRGDNHFKAIYDAAIGDPEWFCQILPASETGVFTKATLAKELEELQRERGEQEGKSLYEQEYNCSFSAALSGSYYGSFMEQLDQQERIGSVPHDPRFPVHLSFDLGVNDQTVIWAAQLIGQDIHFIDCISGSGQGIEFYIKMVQSRPWTLGTIILPHDAAAREITTARTRLSMFRSQGLQNIQVLANERIAEGIQAVRTMLPMCRFDAKNCQQGIRALKQYRREFNAQRDIYEDKPVHDRNSDFADSFRYFALGNITNRKAKAIKYNTSWVI